MGTIPLKDYFDGKIAEVERLIRETREYIDKIEKSRLVALQLADDARAEALEIARETLEKHLELLNNHAAALIQQQATYVLKTTYEKDIENLKATDSVIKAELVREVSALRSETSRLIENVSHELGVSLGSMEGRLRSQLDAHQEDIEEFKKYMNTQQGRAIATGVITSALTSSIVGYIVSEILRR